MKLTVTTPHDENTEGFERKISRSTYLRRYHAATMAPNRVEYTFKRLSPDGVENLKKAAQESFKESQYKKSCHFKTEND